MDLDQAFDAAVRLELYRFFVDQGRPPVPAEIAEALPSDQASVESSIHRLADAHVLVLAPGTPYIWMANPLSAFPTPFWVDTPRGSYFGNCIWDAFGIVAMLGGTGAVSTSCPDCNAPLRLSVEDGVLQEREGLAHFAVPARHWWDNIGYT